MESEIRAVIVPLAERLIKQLTEVREKSAHQPLDLFALELLVSKLLAQFALSLLAGLIGLWHGRDKVTPRIRCQDCGSLLRVQKYLRRPVICCFGRFSYERAYYYCRACHQSRFPLDESLGVGERECSPRLQRVLAYLSAHLSFGVVEQAVRECYELGLNHETIRQVAEDVGAQARAWEERERQVYEESAVVPGPTTGRAKTWIIECDGNQVGLQDGRWQEVKVGLVYELGARVEPYTGRHELLKRELVARRCRWEGFASHFWCALQHAGVRAGDRFVAVADGAHAISANLFVYRAASDPHSRFLSCGRAGSCHR